MDSDQDIGIQQFGKIIPNGVYKILNVGVSAFADLKDNRDGEPLTNTKNKVAETIEWRVTLKGEVAGNGIYTIRHIVFPTKLAYYPQSVAPGTVVTSEPEEKEWIIRESEIDGQYYVSPLPTPGLNWYLENDIPITPIIVIGDTSKKSHWIFYLQAHN